ncbi:MAG: ribose-5-phosphate isomerase RpiA [Myxococcales bacterium]
MTTDREREKQRAAEAAVALVADGMALGLGSGSSVNHVVRALAQRVTLGLRVRVVSASRATEALATQLGIHVSDFEHGSELDLTIDGADEVDPQLRLVKGGGGALLREKVVAFAARQTVIVVDSSKLVDVLGAFPLPVEVLPFATPVVLRALCNLGCVPSLRAQPDGRPYLTDQHNHVIDCAFGALERPREVANKLSEIPGLLGHGLFLDEASRVLVGRSDEVEVLTR